MILEDIIKDAIQRTLNEVLNKFGEVPNYSKIEITITYRYKQSGEERDKSKMLNELLKHREDVIFSQQKIMEIILDRGFEESNELCEVCKFRNAVKLKDELRDLVGENAKLCNVCLAVRLSPFYIGRGSTTRKGESLSENEKRGWGSLLEIDENNKRSRSIDEISSDDVVFLVMKLNLNKWDIRYVNLKDYYRTVMIKYYYNNIRKIKPYIREFLENIKKIIENINTENVNDDKVKICLKNITNLEIDDNLVEKFINFDNSNLFNKIINNNLNFEKVDRNKLAEFLYTEANCSGNKDRLVNNIKTILQENLQVSIQVEDEITKDINQELLKKSSKCINNPECFNDISPLLSKVDKVDIPKSLDREFSLRAHFSILGEEILALLYMRIKRRPQQIILITPSMTTPLLMTVIRKEDLHEVIGILKELYQVTSNELNPIPDSILIYLIKAKVYTPIQYILEIINKEIEIESNSNTSIKVIPIIVGRNNIPLTSLYAFTLSEFINTYEKVLSEIENKESFAEFFITSAQDIPYPEFKNYEKFPDLEEKYVKKYKGEMYSVVHDRDDIGKVYIARLLI